MLDGFLAVGKNYNHCIWVARCIVVVPVAAQLEPFEAAVAAVLAPVQMSPLGRMKARSPLLCYYQMADLTMKSLVLVLRTYDVAVAAELVAVNPTLFGLAI